MVLPHDLRDVYLSFFFLMIRRPPRSTLDRSSAASDVYKRQGEEHGAVEAQLALPDGAQPAEDLDAGGDGDDHGGCLLYTSPSPRDRTRSRMPSSA